MQLIVFHAACFVDFCNVALVIANFLSAQCVTHHTQVTSLRLSMHSWFGRLKSPAQQRHVYLCANIIGPVQRALSHRTNKQKATRADAARIVTHFTCESMRKCLNGKHIYTLIICAENQKKTEIRICSCFGKKECTINGQNRRKYVNF